MNAELNKRSPKPVVPTVVAAVVGQPWVPDLVAAALSFGEHMVEGHDVAQHRLVADLSAVAVTLNEASPAVTGYQCPTYPVMPKGVEHVFSTLPVPRVFRRPTP